jgi:spoIIIJ-associated protein
MSEKRASLEVIAPNVEEAVAKGLADLGLPEEAVEVEVLDAGSKGLFGLGSRQARVRISIKVAQEEAAPAARKPAEASATQNAVEEAEAEATVTEAATPQPVAAALLEPLEVAEIPPATEIEPAPEAAGRVEDDQMALRVARETVSELLERMNVGAQVTAHFGEPEDARSRSPLLVEVNGDDLSILIGPRAETLNALQYIAGLIIGKELGRSIPLVVDVEGYRQRRAQQIRQLARRMAEQAIKTGRRQVLEPMPANERRLVHIELRDHPNVTTESIGEEPRRKVTIVPK